jgi:hypothetical protein
MNHEIRWNQENPEGLLNFENSPTIRLGPLSVRQTRALRSRFEEWN